MKYSQLCPYSCLLCCGKLKKVTQFDLVDHYCNECKDGKSTKFRLTYEAGVGNLRFALVQLAEYRIDIFYKLGRTVVSRNVNGQEATYFEITNFDLSSLEKFKTQLSTYLIFR